MILINKEQYTAEEVAAKFGVPYTKLVKTPEFDINPKRTAVKKFGQSRELSVPAGTRVHAYFSIKFEGRSMEIRYAENTYDETVGEKIVQKYHPQKVMFTGESMLVDNMDEDLAMFFYLHPLNELSPFRNQVKEQFHWSFKDMAARGKANKAVMDELGKAYNTISAMSGEKLKIVAKGFNMTGVDDMEDDQIQADLFNNFAKPNPRSFNETVGKNNLMFKGLVMNSIDRGLFILDKSKGGNTWHWGANIHGGAEIVPVLSNSVPAVDVLMNHVLNNINSFYSKIIDAQQSLTATRVAADFLDEQDLDIDALLAGTALPKNPDPNADFGGGTSETSQDPADGQKGQDTTADDSERLELRARYKELFGSAPSNFTGIPKLKEAIANKEAELAGKQ